MVTCSSDETVAKTILMLRWSPTRAPSPSPQDSTDEYVWHLRRTEPRSNLFVYANRGPKMRNGRAFVWFPFRSHLGVWLVDGWALVDFILTYDVEVTRSQAAS